jgi:hypothetical protein
MTAALDTRHHLATQPRLTDELTLIAGDLCDITVSRRYCQLEATTAAVDADGRIRILCAHHTAMYFPTH